MKKLSVLIIDDNEQYAKDCTAYIRSNKDFFEASYALNGKEGLELAKLLKPDVIILDIFMPILDGIGFLRQFNALSHQKRPIIIINSVSQMTAILDTVTSYNVDYFMMKPQPYAEICNTIHDLTARSAAQENKPLMKNADLKTEECITEFIKALGVPAHLIGYQYIKSALLAAVKDMDILTPITKKLYPMLAAEYSTSKSCVERAIRHAITVSWKRGNKKLINDIFGYTDCDNGLHRPTNSEYLAMVADELRMRMRYDKALS